MSAYSTGLPDKVLAKAGLPTSGKVAFGGYGFIENKGQIIDQDNKPNKEVLYLYNGNGLQVQLRQNGFSYEVIKKAAGSWPLASGNSINNLEIVGTHSMADNKEIDSIFIHRVDILFEGINKNIQIIPFNPSSDYINYYTGSPVRAPLAGALPPDQNLHLENNGITHVHHYKKIYYQNIYPNIDVEFILNPANPAHPFKYNFIIHAGGNINDIKLKFLGATNTSLTEDGHITIETAYGNIDESIPYSYQLNDKNQQQTVLSKFSYTEPEASGQQPEANIFGIEAKNYDPTKTLVIDPIPWATYFGGNQADYGSDISTDLNGNVLVVGWTNSTTNIATTGAYQSIKGGSIGSPDCFIVKLNSTGIPQWATYYGGIGNDYGDGIDADTSGNIFISGYSNSTLGIATTGAYQTSYGGGNNDAFIAKFNTSGALLWGTYYGGSLSDYSGDICIDFNSNILITGSTLSDSGIATTSAHQTLIGGGTDAYLAKFNALGTLLWASYYGGSSDDQAGRIATDLNGNLLITGYTNSASGIATSGAYQTSYGGGNNDAFIAKFNPSGSIQWSTYLGGVANDYGSGIICDMSGNIFVTGSTNSISSIATSGAYQTNYGGGTEDAYIVKFSASGIMKWGTYFGGPSGDAANCIISDLYGNLLISGATASTNGIATTGAYQTIFGGGGLDAILAKFDSSGALLWCTYFGGASVETSSNICTDLNGSVFATGWTTSSTNIASAGAYQTTYGGSRDAFIFSLPVSPGLPSITNNTISSSQGICSGTLPASLTGITPTGGNGTYIYTWFSSTTSSTSGFILASGTNNSINYSPPALSSNIWYKRVVSSGGYFDTSNVIAITVGSKLNVGFTVNQLIQCIKTNNFIFTDTTTASGTITRLWDFGNGTTSTLMNPNISYNFNIANAYWVKLESSINGACVDSAKQRVFVISNPAPTGAINGNTVVNRLSTYTYSVPATMGSSYQWIFSNGIGSNTGNSINIKWNVIGTIDLKVVEFSGGGCAGDTVYQSININPGVGLDGFDEKNDFCIYPNPAISILNVQLEKVLNEKIFVEIISIDGKQTQSAWLYPMETQISFITDDITPGMYFIRLCGNTIQQSKKFIIK